MARYIDEVKLIRELAKIRDLRTLSTKTVGEAIANTPTADVAEVVRCKDCKYKKVGHNPLGAYCYCCNDEGGLDNINNENKDFCSYGEMRDT